MKVLICCDYSIAGEHILRKAQEFLTAFPSAELHIYNVIDTSVISVSGMYNNNELLNSLEKEAQEVKKWADVIFQEKKIDFSTEIGYPAVAIVQKARILPADLLILGTHGRTGLGHILIGSVAENVLRRTTCNTLVIPVKHLKNG